MKMEQLFLDFIKQTINKSLPITITIGKVKKINDDVCDIERDELPELIDVRLNVIENNLQSYFRIIPKIGSYVICGLIENSQEAIIIQYSEIEKFEIMFNKTIFSIDDNKINFNGDDIMFNNGQNGGMLIAPKLKDELKKNNDIFKNILDVINGSPINEAGNGSPSVLQLKLKSSLAGLSIGDFSKIENEKIKH